MCSADRVGSRIDACGGPRGLIVDMDAHIAQIAAETWLEECARGAVERLAGRVQGSPYEREVHALGAGRPGFLAHYAPCSRLACMPRIFRRQRGAARARPAEPRPDAHVRERQPRPASRPAHHVVGDALGVALEGVGRIADAHRPCGANRSRSILAFYLSQRHAPAHPPTPFPIARAAARPSLRAPAIPGSVATFPPRTTATLRERARSSPLAGPESVRTSSAFSASIKRHSIRRVDAAQCRAGRS